MRLLPARSSSSCSAALCPLFSRLISCSPAALPGGPVAGAFTESLLVILAAALSSHPRRLLPVPPSSSKSDTLCPEMQAPCQICLPVYPGSTTVWPHPRRLALEFICSSSRASPYAGTLWGPRRGRLQCTRWRGPQVGLQLEVAGEHGGGAAAGVILAHLPLGGSVLLPPEQEQAKASAGLCQV